MFNISALTRNGLKYFLTAHISQAAHGLHKCVQISKRRGEQSVFRGLAIKSIVRNGPGPVLTVEGSLCLGAFQQLVSLLEIGPDSDGADLLFLYAGHDHNCHRTLPRHSALTKTGRTGTQGRGGREIITTALTVWG